MALSLAASHGVTISTVPSWAGRVLEAVRFHLASREPLLGDVFAIAFIDSDGVPRIYLGTPGGALSGLAGFLKDGLLDRAELADAASTVPGSIKVACFGHDSSDTARGYVATIPNPFNAPPTTDRR